MYSYPVRAVVRLVTYMLVMAIKRLFRDIQSFLDSSDAYTSTPY
jgi:hypothetical protein